MNTKTLTVREINENDIEAITNYWLNSDPGFLFNMGVDLSKIPDSNEWKKSLTEQIRLPYELKKSYCMMWLLNGEAIGHSNVNKIIYAKEAFMHLHLWNTQQRNKGLGCTFIKMTLPYFFANLKLKKIYCEPYFLNPSPNKVLNKIGFKMVKQYTTIPGWLNYEQSVNLWELNANDFNRA